MVSTSIYQGGDRYIKNLLGVDHAGIGSDLRGMRSYNEGFGDEANFNAVAEALADAGYSDEDIAKVMGGTTSMGRSDATTEPAAAPAPSSTEE